MIFELLRDYAKREPGRLFLRNEPVTAREAFERCCHIARSLAALNSPRIYFYAADSIDLVLCLIASQAVDLEVCVLNRSFKTTEIQAILERLGKGALVVDAPLEIPDAAVHQLASVVAFSHSEPVSDEADSDDKGAIIILTTGTTGVPKAASTNGSGCWHGQGGKGKVRKSSQLAAGISAESLCRYPGCPACVAEPRNTGNPLFPGLRANHYHHN